MVLSDRTIREELAKGRLVIEPFDDSCIQPASVDLHLDRKFLVFNNFKRPYIDVRVPSDDINDQVEIEDGVPFMLHPGSFVLAGILERVVLPDDLMGRLEGKSSLARLGLLIHSTAGFIDPGWDGRLTLELHNVFPIPLTLYYGMKIAHISFTRLTTCAENPYGSEKLGSKYQGQSGPVPSRAYLDYQLPLIS